MFAANVPTKPEFLSLGNTLNKPWLHITPSMILSAVMSTSLFYVANASTYFDCLSITVNIYSFPLFALGNGPI